MKNIMKYLLMVMFAPVVVLGMEPDRKKVCRYESLPNALEQRLSRAQTSHILKIDCLEDFAVSKSLYFVERCMRLADRIRALPLHTVELKSLMDNDDIQIEGLKTITDGLSISPTLQRLELPFTRFDQLGQKRLRLIEGIIQRAPRLAALDLSYCRLAFLLAHDLSSFLHTLTQKRIDRLGLRSNALGYNELACQQVFDALRLMAHSLQALSLWDNGLHYFSADNWRALGRVIGGLKELDLGYNGLGQSFRLPMSDDSWRVLLGELARSEIEKLGIKDNYLNEVNDAVWELFTHTIACMQNLKKLDLRGNQFKKISYERFELLSSSLLCHDGMTVIIRNSDDPHHWWARLHGEHGLNVVVK